MTPACPNYGTTQAVYNTTTQIITHRNFTLYRLYYPAIHKHTLPPIKMRSAGRIRAAKLHEEGELLRGGPPRDQLHDEHRQQRGRPLLEQRHRPLDAELDERIRGAVKQEGRRAVSQDYHAQARRRRRLGASRADGSARRAVERSERRVESPAQALDERSRLGYYACVRVGSLCDEFSS